MKSYIGTKTIQAKPMNRLAYNDLRGWTIPADENPNDEGYLVVYTDSPDRNVVGYDGYVSWSPKQVLRDAYRSKNFTFGQAVEFLKSGKRVARSGWNGKGMFLFLVSGKCVTEEINDCYGDNYRYEKDEQSIPVLDAIYMKTADNKLVPWLASQTDVLSEDWQLV